MVRLTGLGGLEEGSHEFGGEADHDFVFEQKWGSWGGGERKKEVKG